VITIDDVKRGRRSIESRWHEQEVAMNQDPHTHYPAFIMLSSKDIAARAYEMYLTRGAYDGFDREDWLRAEQELKARGRDAYSRRTVDDRRLPDGDRRISGADVVPPGTPLGSDGDGAASSGTG
jgi:hypothetical protein